MVELRDDGSAAAGAEFAGGVESGLQAIIRQAVLDRADPVIDVAGAGLAMKDGREALLNVGHVGGAGRGTLGGEVQPGVNGADRHGLRTRAAQAAAVGSDRVSAACGNLNAVAARGEGRPLNRNANLKIEISF